MTRRIVNGLLVLVGIVGLNACGAAPSTHVSAGVETTVKTAVAATVQASIPPMVSTVAPAPVSTSGLIPTPPSRPTVALTSVPSPAASVSTKTDASVIQVVAKTIIFLADQTGGRFHSVFVLLKNTSDQVAIGVSGQVSITKGGSLVKSFNPNSMNLLPGGQGIWEESLNLSEPAPDAVVDTIVSVRGFRPGPGQASLSFSETTFKRDGRTCSVSGVVKNSFNQQKANLQVRVLGLNGPNIVTGGFTYVDQVFPGRDATWTVDLFSSSLCPPSVEQFLVLPNLSEDKIFNP